MEEKNSWVVVCCPGGAELELGCRLENEVLARERAAEQESIIY